MVCRRGQVRARADSAGASIASVVIGLAAPTGTEIGTIKMISPGYTTLGTPDGRHIVLPNAIAASQVTINLTQADKGTTPAALQLPVAIRIGRDTDVEAARKLALDVAAKAVDKEGVMGFFLTQMDATSATLQLRLRARGERSRQIAIEVTGACVQRGASR